MDKLVSVSSDVPTTPWRFSRRILLIVAVLVALACGREPATPDATPGKEDPRTAEVTAREGVPASPDFAGEVPDLRKTIRSASLQPWVELAEDLPCYRIKVTVDPDFMSYEGSLELWVKNRSADPWPQLSFHLYPNMPAIAGDLRYLKVTRTRVAGEEVTGRDQLTRFEVPLAKALAPGEATTVQLDFKGLVKRGRVHPADPTREAWQMLLEMFGDDAGDYGIFAYSSGTVSLSLWYPILAAYDASGWDVAPADELGDFSYFDVADVALSLTLPGDFQVATTGVVTAHEGVRYDAAAGAVREMTVVAGRDLHQLARGTGRQGPVQVRSLFRADAPQTGRQVLDTAAAALDVYEELFGPYPYTELDVVETDLFGGAGGVEFPGLVTIASFLYFDSWKKAAPESAALLSSRFMTESVDFVVAHEVAHQWWNAVVGSHSRNHPFVDEAMANYSAILYFERHKGEEAARRQRLIELHLPYQIHRFMGGEDMPVNRPTREYKNVMEYSAIVYAKGALFLHRLRHVVGDAAFFKGLSEYYETYRFALASPEALVTSLSAHSGQEERARDVAKRWLEERHGDGDIGLFDPAEMVPLLLAELDIELDGFILSQLKEDGFWQLVRLAGNVVEGEEDMFRGVNVESLMEWGAALGKKLVWDVLL